MKRFIFAIPLVLSATALHAHEIGAATETGPRDWHELARSWGWEPVSWTVLIVTAVLYIVGVRRTWRRAGRVGAGVKRWEAASFAAGWLSLFVALVSPLHPWGQVLMSAHMTQHEILMLVAAPLLVLGRPLSVFMTALPTSLARSLAQMSNARAWQTTWHVFSNPFVAWMVHALALWMWHIPTLFDATLHSELVHFLQHASFILTAIIFWWAVITSRSAAMSYGGALLYMFTTALHTQVLGVLMTFSKTVWYPTYRYTTESWGLTPLEDQQLGGLIMWIPAGVVYIIAALALVVGWMRESERRLERAGSTFAHCTAAVLLCASLILTSTACDSRSSADERSQQALGVDPNLGREKIEYYGCASCHTIPGVPGADGLVGPSLEHVASRAYVGGVIENTPANVVKWIQDPPSIDPQTGMPNVRVSPEDAQAIASYLYTLK